MTTLIAFHEVDSVDRWLGSPRRGEFFRPLGLAVRTFVDPEKSNVTGVILDVPDMDAFQQAMESDAAAGAMEFDGVRPDTLVVLAEA